MNALKRLAARLSPRMQQELKRWHFANQIRRGSFHRAIENEPEFDRLDEWVRPGDWVLDVGANVGNYTARLSDLVGSTGRVVAIEPVPDTFELLASNVRRLTLANVTLLNVAASDGYGLAGMAMPTLQTGIVNPYEAHLTADGSGTSVLRMPLDAFKWPRPIRLVKVDVEGHEYEALQGMRWLLWRDRPVLIVEGRSPAVEHTLTELGYLLTEDAGSPNRVFTHVEAVAAFA